MGAITSAEPDKWKKVDYAAFSVVTYQQVLLAMMPDRVLSIEVRDNGELVLSNQPRPRHVAWAYIMIGFLILFELFGIILTIQQMTAHGFVWSEAARGLALLAVAPIFLYGVASLSGWLGYQTSRGLFIRLAYELVALPGVTYRSPSQTD